MSTLLNKDAITGPKVGPPRVNTETESHKPEDGQPNADLRLFEPSPIPQQRRHATAKGDRLVRQNELAVELRDACVTLARRVRDAFKDACLSESPEEAEASFTSAKHLIDNLWEYAYLRDRPFRDLLALVDAAVKRSDLGKLSEAQRDVLRQAICDLPRWLLEDATVEGHIDRFAAHDVDITGPLHVNAGKRVRVTFEMIESDD